MAGEAEERYSYSSRLDALKIDKLERELARTNKLLQYKLHRLEKTTQQLDEQTSLRRRAEAQEFKLGWELERLKCEHVKLKAQLDESDGKLCLDSREGKEDALLRSKLNDMEACEGELRRELAEAVLLLRVKDSQLQGKDDELKALRNRITVLAGRIRVFCRVRPLSEKEKAKKDSAMALKLPDNNVENIVEVTGQGRFKFDKVFPPQATQPDVFQEDISDLVASALDGYKVCIFAYGQTGSGKTFTMFGDSKEASLCGIIPRSVERIFRDCCEKSTLGWEFTIGISFLEIHNEVIRDLLKGLKEENSTDQSAISKPGKGTAPVKKYAGNPNGIHHLKDGSTTVDDLKVVTAKSVEHATEVLVYGNEKRSVGQTDMNKDSSRSHAVFTLRLNGRNRVTGEETHGVLNLVDLAGSERLKKSNATGSTKIESIAINKSLSSLSGVLEAIAKGERPRYREGTLTLLLQGSLEKDSKTLMLLNISPDASSSDETIGSLKFGVMVSTIETGAASRDVRTADSIEENHSSSNASRPGGKRQRQ